MIILNKTAALNLRDIVASLTDESDVKRLAGYAIVTTDGDVAARVYAFNGSVKVAWYEVGFVTPEVARAYALAILRAADVAEEMEAGNGGNLEAKENR